MKGTKQRTALQAIGLGNAISYVAVHVIAIGGAFMIAPRWNDIVLFAGLYCLRMFGITAGYHRYFSHRSFKTSRAFQFVLAVLGTLAAQKGVLWWTAHHRHHHRHSDTPHDHHSPLQHGFFWAHVGWFLSAQHEETDYRAVQDFAQFPELRFLNTFHIVPACALGALVWAAGGMSALVWAFGLSTVCCWHATYLINSLAHRFGSRAFDTPDQSRNSFLLAILTLGEGWHNNHHRYPHSTRQGFTADEIDISYYVLLGLSSLGIIWGIREVPDSVLASRGAKQHARTNRLLLSPHANHEPI